MPLLTPDARVYVFYNYNGDNIRSAGDKKLQYVTILGWYAFKYSDDNGRTWSKKRYRLPMRVTACDRSNDWGGKVQMFWGIDKPNIIDGSVFFAITKLNRYYLINGEGWLYRSRNILTEKDPEKIHWELLPQGEHGIRADEFGSTQEEYTLVPLSDGALYCVYRTQLGYPCHAFSTDAGRSWTTPEFMTYTLSGRRMKTPRACPQIWRTAHGKFLFWYHNHSLPEWLPRNPAWLAGGVE